MINIGILFIGVAFGGIGALRERTIKDYSLYAQEFIGRFTEDLVLHSDRYAYQITNKRLGFGEVGVVYEAIQRSKEPSSDDAVVNRVALKCMFPHIRKPGSLHPDELDDVKRLEGKYLERELSIVEELGQRPFLLATLDHFVDDGFECAALELGGPSLDKYVEGPLRFEFCRAVNIGVQMVTAIAELHKANVVHGDFHPGNILLGTAADPTANVKVIDFESARKLPKPDRGLFREDVYKLVEGVAKLLEKSAPDESREAVNSLRSVPERIDSVSQTMTSIKDSNCPAEAAVAAAAVSGS